MMSGLKGTNRILSVAVLAVWAATVGGAAGAAGAGGPVRPPYYPAPAESYVAPPEGFIHGVQYWVNPGVTDERIFDDFRKMAEEDRINGARLAFWTMPVGIDPTPRLERFDVCFKAAARYGVKLNPVLPQIPGWINGEADKPENREAYKRHIQPMVARYKDEPALAMWTVDIEPSRSWKAEPSDATLAWFRQWLPSRYPSEAEFLRRNWGVESAEVPAQQSFAQAVPVRDRSEGGWNNFSGIADWMTFTAYALAEQVHFVARCVREIDPVHPTSCTPPDVLHNQMVENGRNMWWLADVVDCPSAQVHSIWHFETADMPKDVWAATGASVRKIFCSARNRPATYSGEILGGLDLAEAQRTQSPTAEELLGTALTHLAEGSKGYYLWLWNPLEEGPNAGAWSFRESDGSPSEKSVLLARFGRMASEHGRLLGDLRPADTRIAVFDSLDAAVYMYRRSSYHAMSKWYAMNQYGFYRALRTAQVACDFIDEIGLLNGEGRRYDCIYVPFSMCMTPEVAAALRAYVREGGTVVADAMTGFTPPWHQPFADQPGFDLQEVFGLQALQPRMAYGGFSDVTERGGNEYFERHSARPPREEDLRLFDVEGRQTPLVAMRYIQPVRPKGARVLLRDGEGRPVATEHRYGEGRAVWTGTLLGLTCRNADTPVERSLAVADLVRPYITPAPWTLEAPAGSIVCRRLTGASGDVFVLLNEAAEAAEFTLRLERDAEARELLWPDDAPWTQASGSVIQGRLAGRAGAVISCPAGNPAG